MSDDVSKSDIVQEVEKMAEGVVEMDAGKPGPANLVYILYLVSLLVGITAIVGVVIAYLNRGEAPSWLASHYTFQIRTFWIAFLGGLVAIVTAIIFVGYVVMLAVAVWMVIRCIKGMKALGERQPVPDPETWLF